MASYVAFNQSVIKHLQVKRLLFDYTGSLFFSSQSNLFTHQISKFWGQESIAQMRTAKKSTTYGIVSNSAVSLFPWDHDYGNTEYEMQ